jgi:hypothetical protein
LAAAPASALSISVSGNRLVDPGGNTVVLRGVDRDGTEYACAGSREGHSKGYGFTESRHYTSVDSPAMIAAIRSWGVNAVRVPLNEACWLGINGAVRRWTGARYRDRVATFVSRLEAAGIYPILDLHVVDPGHYPIDASQDGFGPLPDVTHTPAFWSSVAKRFGNDTGVLLDLYNEPNHVGWSCLLRGCRVRHTSYSKLPGYQAVGMQRLVNVVRRAGAKNILMIGGLDWSANLSQWLSFRPQDPLNNVAASLHTYEENRHCFEPHCWGADADEAVAAQVPLIAGEFGDNDCDHDYADAFMQWADAHGVSYLAWAWDAAPHYPCSGGPALITNYNDGTPTKYGVGVRDHLRALAGIG